MPEPDTVACPRCGGFDHELCSSDGRAVRVPTTTTTAARVARCACVLTGMFVLDVIAAVVVDIYWRPAVLALLVGFALAWLTVVALIMFQEARGAR